MSIMKRLDHILSTPGLIRAAKSYTVFKTDTAFVFVVSGRSPNPRSASGALHKEAIFQAHEARLRPKREDFSNVQSRADLEALEQRTNTCVIPFSSIIETHIDAQGSICHRIIIRYNIDTAKKKTIYTYNMKRTDVEAFFVVDTSAQMASHLASNNAPHPSDTSIGSA